MTFSCLVPRAAGGIERRAVRVSGSQLRSAPWDSRYSAARRWPPAQACQNACDTSPAGGSLPRIASRRLSMPKAAACQGLVNSGAARYQEAGDMPATVANGVIERSADRTVGHLDIRSSVDQGRGHVGVWP